MNRKPDFIEMIVEAFLSLRERPHLDVLARQFAEGEVTFLVDNEGIRMHLGRVVPDAPDIDPSVL